MPVLYAIAGGPASGKSTFIQEALRSGTLPSSAHLHDCDAVMLSLPGYLLDLHTLGPKMAFANWELPARSLAEQDLMIAVNQKRDIIYDRSCALQSSYEFLKSAVKMHGYRLIMHWIRCDLGLAVRRAKEREKLTGRHIPEELIHERTEALALLWPKYIALAHESSIIEQKE